ncbi:MAG: hypothetical protein K0B06_10910 [Brevefilum sp.]|nr:hypothetical protein [Brevefilum sp.]
MLILWLIPLGVVIMLLGLTPLGMVLIGLISILLLYSLLMWGEVTALETSRAFNAITRGDFSLLEAMDQTPVFVHWKDIALWVLMLPGMELIRFFNQVFQPYKAEKHDWLGGSFVMLPVIALEALNLSEAVERIKQLDRERLLGFHPELIGISPVVGVLQWLLILVGGIVGYWVGLIMADPVTAGVLSRLLAITIGVLLAGSLALMGISFSSFNRACYYTTLYQWALNVEQARSSGDTSRGLAPVILSQVMRKTKPSKKES